MSVHDEKARYKAVVLYKLTGNKHITAREAGVSLQTIHNWVKEDWFKERTAELKLEDRSGLSANLRKIADRAIAEVEDRLENGDWVYDQKLSRMIRKPVNAHVANKILNDSINQHNKNEELKEQDARWADKAQIQDTLSKLALEFKKFAKMRLIEGERIDENAVYEEREEGLQGRTLLGAPPSGEAEATGGETCGPSPHDEERTGT